ncbi:hypothetical protein B9Z55_027788 [Caenorhabditis nigoni]|uniref:F-box domain-containing protein n=1 Tax=Caenorhabditis nigoni TaxID=1611254 RepID=A0A2G5SEV1_9PELO|nr:hypothetical protein B9Z55_027788 [Caenorhabditis nigoni]
MAEWVDLPEKFKKDVVENLDLMSRFSMRNVSKSDREIVDSVDFYVPRVRYSVKTDGKKCLIMIYSGIEKFWRIEISENWKGNVVVKKTQDTYNLNEALTKEISGTSSILLSSSILKSLLIQESILIGTFELEHDNYDLIPQINVYDPISSVLGAKAGGWDNIFNAKKLLCNWMVHPKIIEFYRTLLFNSNTLEEIAHEGIALEPENMVPVKILENNTKYGNRLNIRRSDFWTAERPDENKHRMIPKFKDSDGYATCRLVSKMHFKLFDDQRFPIKRLNSKVLMKRITVPQNGVVARWNKSECGVWIHMMKMNNESKYHDFFKNETCGLRWLCEKCSDPFDYWYYRNLPRRVIDEAEWIDIAYRSCEKSPLPDEEDLNRNIKKLKDKFVLENESNPKPQKKGAESKSRGFGTSKNSNSFEGTLIGRLDGFSLKKVGSVQFADFEITSRIYLLIEFACRNHQPSSPLGPSSKRQKLTEGEASTPFQPAQLYRKEKYNF